MCRGAARTRSTPSASPTTRPAGSAPCSPACTSSRRQSREVEAVIGGLLIDWVTLHEGSPGVGRSIADLEIRRRTRMTVAAIVRDDATLVAPDPSTVLEVGDRLVVIGRPEDLVTFLGTVVT